MGTNYEVTNAGDVTATSFSGDGSGLTSLPGGGGGNLVDVSTHSSTGTSGGSYAGFTGLTGAKTYLVRYKITELGSGGGSVIVRLNGAGSHWYDVMNAGVVTHAASDGNGINISGIGTSDVLEGSFWISIGNSTTRPMLDPIGIAFDDTYRKWIMAGGKDIKANITSIEMTIINRSFDLEMDLHEVQEI